MEQDTAKDLIARWRPWRRLLRAGGRGRECECECAGRSLSRACIWATRLPQSALAKRAMYSNAGKAARR